MKTDLYVGKHFSLHYTYVNSDFFEFHVFPFVTVDASRILVGFLFFTLQYSYEENIDEDDYA